LPAVNSSDAVCLLTHGRDLSLPSSPLPAYRRAVQLLSTVDANKQQLLLIP